MKRQRVRNGAFLRWDFPRSALTRKFAFPAAQLLSDSSDPDGALRALVSDAARGFCGTATARVGSGGAVVKAVQIQDDASLEKAKRELQIAAQLKTLAQEESCARGFVDLTRFAVVHMDDGTRQQQHREFLLMESPFGGETLRHAGQTLSQAELRDVAFQTTYALHTAQRRFEFCHQDLHADNIVVQRTSGISGAFLLADGPATTDKRFTSTGIVARILDFGLSRCWVEDVGLCSPPLQSTGFAPSVDRESLAGVLSSVASKMASRSKEGAEHRLFSSFLRALRSCNTPMLSLLTHPYFAPLRAAPRQPADSSKLVWSSLLVGSPTPTLLGPLDRFVVRASKAEALVRIFNFSSRRV